MNQNLLAYPESATREIAVCRTNSHGRLLSANHRFCRMFGIQPESVEWRYLIDFHRHQADWEKFRQTMEKAGRVDHCVLRLRHRKGRSFPCVVSSMRVLDENGGVCYQIQIRKIVAGESLQNVALSPGSANFQGFIGVCHACGQLKGVDGRWFSPMRPVKPASQRQISYCPQCSSRLFPGLLDNQPSQMVAAE